MAKVLEIRTNVSQGTAVEIDDLGAIIIPASGGAETFDEYAEIELAIESEDLRAYLIDDAHGANSSTLQLYDQDAAALVAQADVLDYLDNLNTASVELHGNYGFLQSDASGDVDAGGGEITNIANATSGTSVPSLSQVQGLVASGAIWKELLLSCGQLDDTNDAISQAIPFWMREQPVSGDNLIITDGSTIRTYQFATGGDVTVTIGADVDESMENLVAAITGDGSGLWDALDVTTLEELNDGTGSVTAGKVVVIYRANQSADSFDDRIYGTFATAANARYHSFNGEADYSSTSDTELISADPSEKQFGFGRSTASLTTGELHHCRDDDATYSWDGDDGVWQQTSTAGLTFSNGLVNTAGNVTPDYGEVGDIANVLATGPAVAGATGEIADAGHQHVHGDLSGTDTPHHDTTQIDEDATLARIGAPDSQDQVNAQINANFGSGQYVGDTFVLNLRQRVPGGGQRYMDFGEVPSNEVGIRMTRPGTIVEASIQSEAADGSNDYDLDVEINGSSVDQVALSSGVAGAHDLTFSSNFVAGDTISASLQRTSGSGSSSSNRWVAIVRVIYTG